MRYVMETENTTQENIGLREKVIGFSQVLLHFQGGYTISDRRMNMNYPVLL